MKLWEGRIQGSLTFEAARLNNSIDFDRRLAAADVTASQAWARAIARAGILSAPELEEILSGLNGIQAEFANGSFVFYDTDEDIHTAVERRLGEIIGPTAGKLHTGRSRNDQVATDFRLWLAAEMNRLEDLLVGLQTALVERAKKDFGMVVPGYTHTRPAQPVLLSHWWLAHFWALQRDRIRLVECKQHLLVLPLGSGALAGTGFPIDRFALASDLGFPAVSPNSIDAVSDRDFAAEFLFWAALLGVHLSRLAEALILFSTPEFGFFGIADEYSTGSSLMPHKKNPDPLELSRGKSGALIGLLTGWLVTLKGLPSAYDKDLQEDKPAVFTSADMIALLLPVMTGVINSLTVDSLRCRSAVTDEMLATDIADRLVRSGIPFRQAHKITGQAVARAEALRIPLLQLPLEEWRVIDPGLSPDLISGLDVELAVSNHSAYGGTAPEAVKKQIAEAGQCLAGNCAS